MNFAKFLRTPFLQNTSVRLLLTFVNFLSSCKKSEKLTIFESLISEWQGLILVGLLPITLSNANVEMFLWLFCDGDNKIVCYIFNPTVFIHWTIAFVSAITWCHRFFVCFSNSFMSFHHVAYIFHTTLAEFNPIPVKYFK